MRRSIRWLVNVEMSSKGGRSGGASLVRRGEEVMGWRGGHDSFTLGQWRNDRIAGCSVGGSEVGYPIYGGGN